MHSPKHLIIFACIVVGLVFAGLTIKLVWAILEVMYGPLFPEWVYHLIQMEF